MGPNRPNYGTPVFIKHTDDILRAIADSLSAISNTASERIKSLSDTEIITGAPIEVVGMPGYVSDVSQHARFGITEPGWYVFCRIASKDGSAVTDETTVEGAAGYIITPPNNYVELAVMFEVAAISKKVTINWGTYTESFIFKATDLAIRNLDYRVTFYVYDIADFATWEYTPATDATFDAEKYYYTESDGVYTLAEVIAGDPVPTYYEDAYALTADETFVSGKTYYTLADGVYTVATVTEGEAVTDDTYYEHSYVITKDTVFADGKAYYTKSDTAYAEATVTAGDTVPTVYYVHSKVTFEGMTRNITYVCNTPIDCPQTYVLPEIEDETHGCWYEIRLRHTGTFSSTLVVPEGVKIATEHTQAETAGLNMVNLHYTAVGETKLWRFMNTHSTIPA